MSGIVIRSRESGEVKEIPVEGIFIEIGLIPNSEFAWDVVNLNKYGEIVVDCYCRTSVPKVIINEDIRFEGALPEPLFVAKVMKIEREK
ncbi:MAG: FAD-dependent oxidoreductase [Nitrospirota bacterium]